MISVKVNKSDPTDLYVATIYSALAVVLNLATESSSERTVFAPIAIFLCVVVVTTMIGSRRTTWLPGPRRRATLMVIVRHWVVVLAIAASLVAADSFAGQPAGSIGPGDRLAGMRFMKGTERTADLKLFDTCDPVILGAGRYTRRCGRVPRVRRLFVGYGTFALPGRIDTVWRAQSWAAWFDGRRIRLAAFGWSDRTLIRFPPAGSRDVTLREWRVMLVRAIPGRHTIRYRVRDVAGTIDATWTFTVARS